MRVLFALTYYRPHVSGLTIYVERLARALAARGHEVTVLTSAVEGLPDEEVVGGVRVVRAPVTLRLGKAALMARYPRIADRLLREADVVSAHLPQAEAPVLVHRARRAGRPVVLTYHCDLQLPPGLLNRAADVATFAAHAAAAAGAERIVAYTDDYARHSTFLRWVPNRIDVVLPPVSMPAPDAGEVAAFRARHGLRPGQPVIGMAARLAAEKGVETVVGALPALLARFPDLRVLFAGPYEDVLGEEAYRDRIRPVLDALGDRWRFVGVLGEDEMPAFLGALDALLVPSVNRTESFGLVQVEAMLCGTPVVASDIPGVRQPVRMTGMGAVVPPQDPAALAVAVAEVLADPAPLLRTRAELGRLFDLRVTVERYEAVFERALAVA